MGVRTLDATARSACIGKRIRRTRRGPPRHEDRKIELILVRHGQTAWNATRRFQGQTDVPLDDEGRTQALSLAKYLRDVPIALALASDLSRARETAETILQDRDIPLVLDPRLREIRFGDWEGLDWTEIRARYPHLPEAGWSNPREYTPEGGERFDDVHARVAEVLAEVRGRIEPGQRALVVTHAGILHSVMHVLQPSGVPPLRIRFQTASITRVRLNGETAELATLNEHPVGKPR